MSRLVNFKVKIYLNLGSKLTWKCILDVCQLKHIKFKIEMRVYDIISQSRQEQRWETR